MNENSNIDRDTLNLERDRLRLERQKTAIDLLLKRKELSLRRSLLSIIINNPVSVAIISALLAVLVNSVTSYFSARYNREAAKETLQADLVKKFVEGPSPDAVRSNLKFLVDANLIPTYAENIKNYLKDNPGSAPQIQTTYSGGIIGADDAIPMSRLPRSDPFVLLGQSVGRLFSTDGQNRCTAFIIGLDLIATAGHCVQRDAEMIFAIGDYKEKVTVIFSQSSGNEKISYALLRFNQEPRLPRRALKIAKKLPSSVPLASDDSQIGVRMRVCLYGQD